jgi:hypothetical protein
VNGIHSILASRTPKVNQKRHTLPQFLNLLAGMGGREKAKRAGGLFHKKDSPAKRRGQK